ncbi:hypothetical protein [Devosia pacifica]|uniref:hypothetical protein n=1 Tax=Devosia pacifica TaxID=1335967 RepID=UPI0016728B02|nr:hypothetical protein [Devosia pacifica]
MPIVSFWHGQLSFLERVCIASFLEKGHRFILFAYDEVGPVPKGTELRDASELVPQDQMFFYKGNRTPAVFADYMRLVLMERGTGIWADCDVYCVRPFENLPEYVFGIEAEPSWRNGFTAQINNAVFLCPPECDLLHALKAVFAPGAIPPGLPPWRALEVRIRKALGEDLPVHHMQFGATGPAPLNYYVRTLGLEPFIRSRMTFYPMPYGTATALLEPGSDIAGRIGAETLGIHMWHSALTGRRSGQMLTPQPGSFFAREIERLGV